MCRLHVVHGSMDPSLQGHASGWGIRCPCPHPPLGPRACRSSLACHTATRLTCGVLPAFWQRCGPAARCFQVRGGSGRAGVPRVLAPGRGRGWTPESSWVEGPASAGARAVPDRAASSKSPWAGCHGHGASPARPCPAVLCPARCRRGREGSAGLHPGDPGPCPGRHGPRLAAIVDFFQHRHARACCRWGEGREGGLRCGPPSPL